MLEFKDATIKVGEWILPMRLSFKGDVCDGA